MPASRERNMGHLAAILLIALAVRLPFLGEHGIEGDLFMFRQWGEKLYEVGASRFYSEIGFCDYLPGYLYLLWPLAALGSALGIENWVALYKLPGLLFDLLTVAAVYLVVIRHFPPRRAALVTLAAALNPMAIFNSMMWGQIDGLFTLVLFVSIALLIRERYELSAAVFAVSLAIKLHALLVAPLFLYAFLDKLGPDWRYWTRRLVQSVLSFAAVFWLLLLPFGEGLSPLWAVSFYAETVSGSYSVVSVNAYNLWWALGIHWVEDSTMMGPFSYGIWGYIFIALSVIACGILCVRHRGRSKFLLMGGLLQASIFMLSARMHERYLFAAAMFFLFSYFWDRNRLGLVVGVLFSLHSFFNQIGSQYWDGKFYGLRTALAILGVLVLAGAYAGVICQIRRQEPGSEPVTETQ